MTSTRPTRCRSIPRVAVALALFALPSFAQEGNGRALQIARGSATARAAEKRVREAAAAIKDKAIRAAVLDLLDNPAPTFLTRFPDAAAKASAIGALRDQGLIEPDVAPMALFPSIEDPLRAPQPFLSAPAQALGGHHAYPGGLAEHTAVNLKSALDLAANYRTAYGFDKTSINDDYLVAAPILHDLLKTWVLQWHPNGTLTVQPKVAGTASHHVFDIAEALHRRLPPELALIVACAHAPPFGDGLPRVVGYLRAAAILAGVDPIESGLLRRDGLNWTLAKAPPIEAALHHLSDHDYVLADPIQPVVEAALDRVLGGAGSQARWLRYKALAALPGLRLYQLWSTKGDEGVRAELAARGVTREPQ